MKYASVNDTKLRSPLKEALLLKPRKSRAKKKAVTTLVLTSLVDAFSIILLYLLVQNTSNGSTQELLKTESLPLAMKIEALHKGTVVRVEDGKYFINDELVRSSDIAKKLQALKEQLGNSEDASSLIIQADKSDDFSGLAPVIRAGSITGFNKFKFAVIQDDSAQSEARL